MRYNEITMSKTYVTTHVSIKGVRIAPLHHCSARDDRIARAAHVQDILKRADQAGARPLTPEPRPLLSSKGIVRATREEAAAIVPHFTAPIKGAKVVLPPVDRELRARHAALDAAAARSSSSIDPYHVAMHGYLFATSSKKAGLQQKVELKRARSDLAFDMAMHERVHFPRMTTA